MNKSYMLVHAVRVGDLAAALAALDAGADPNCADDCGDPGLPLRLAACNGHQRLVRELVGRGAEVNPAVRLRSNRPIAAAVHNGQKETVRLLLELGAELPRGLEHALSRREILAAQEIAQRRQEEKAASRLFLATGHCHA